MSRSLLKISELKQDDLIAILALAERISLGNMPNLSHHLSVATLFFENSTRTKVSFELAAKRLGLLYTNVDITKSSVAKGEAFEDMMLTLGAMAIDVFIIRHQQQGLMNIARELLPKASIINAGEGMLAHPTQAILDAFTLLQKFGELSNLKIVITGDIRHSRVARSLITALSLLGAKNIILSAPSYFLTDEPIANTIIETALDKAMVHADVVYTLRVQKERFKESSSFPLDEYVEQYCLTQQRIDKVHKNISIMHPGPINQDVEITKEVANGVNSLILKQVENGVIVRMAILAWVLLGNQSGN